MSKHTKRDRYRLAEKICKGVIIEILNKINSKSMLYIKDLEKFGDTLLINEIQKNYKIDNKRGTGIAFPTSISLNNCVGNYLYSTDRGQNVSGDRDRDVSGDRDQDVSREDRGRNRDVGQNVSGDRDLDVDVVKHGDVVKIEFGVNLDGCIVNIGETIIYTDTENDKLFKKHEPYLKLLEDLKLYILENLRAGETNDEIKINIESMCTQVGCFPVANTTSYQHLDGQAQTLDSKYMICNYKQTGEFESETDYIDNACFEFLKDEVYTIVLKIIPNDDRNDDETLHKYYTLDDCHIYRFNDLFYDLRLRSSREFCSFAKSRHSTNYFDCIQYKDNGKYRLGIRECCEKGILEKLPIQYSRDKLPVYHKKFTIMVKDDKSVTFV